MTFEPFTKKVTDGSNEAGFQFTFYCDICQQAFKSTFVQSKSAKKAGFLHGLAEVANFGAEIGSYAKDPRISQALKSGADQMMRNQQPAGNSAAWHQEHDSAMAAAINEAKSHFTNCPVCKRWVCRNEWDQGASLCIQDAAIKRKNTTGQPGTVISGGISATAQSTNELSAQPPAMHLDSPATVASSLPAGQAPDDPLKVLKVRLAKGEITVDEYLKLKELVNS